jgi:hypothetical protein
MVDALVGFEEIAESEARERPEGHAEEEEVAEVKKHLFDYFVSTSQQKYVNYPPVSSMCNFDMVPNRMMATASLRMPSPKSTALRTGNFSTLIIEFAATVSVAHITLPKIRI